MNRLYSGQRSAKRQNSKCVAAAAAGLFFCFVICGLKYTLPSCDTSVSAGGGERFVERGGGGAATLAVLGLAK